MNIQVNGNSKELPESQNIKELIKSFCRTHNHVIVELNGQIVKPTNWEKIFLKEGDIIELITFVGGG